MSKKCEQMMDCKHCTSRKQCDEEDVIMTPSQLLLDIRMHNSDKSARTSNTFIQRYLEERKLRIPKEKK